MRLAHAGFRPQTHMHSRQTPSRTQRAFCSIFLTIAAVLSRAPHTAASANHAVRVLLFGDSLTAGYWGDGKRWHPYADRLEALLDCPVSYIGLSGWTTEGLLQKRNESNLGVDTRGRTQHGLEKALTEALGEGNPFTHVAILAGTNDLYRMHETGAQFTIDNLRGLHTTAHVRGASTLALTIPQLGLDPSHGDIKAGRAAVNGWLHKYADEKASSPTYVRLVDIEKLLPMHGIDDGLRGRRWESDGIHFTPFGSDEIADSVFDALALDKRVAKFCKTDMARKGTIPKATTAGGALF